MKSRQVVTGLLLFLFLPLSQAAQPLVTVDWLSSNLDTPNVVVLDLQPVTTYNQYHVPGAINSNYADWRKPDAKGTPKMLPKTSELEKLIGGLGISNQTQVVLVVTGRSASELATATRVYWTFKVLGHDAVSILDGGLVAYAQSRTHPLERKVNTPPRTTFKAQLRPEYLITAAGVNDALTSEIARIDHRSGAEHMGLVGGGKVRLGTVPGAKLLPYEWLAIDGGARLHTLENLKQIFQVSDIPLTGPLVSFCHTGHRASLGWFVAHELMGNKEAKMYDGSMAEWAADPSLPMEQKINLKLALNSNTMESWQE